MHESQDRARTSRAREDTSGSEGEERLLAQRAELRALRTTLLRVEERERCRIGAGLHGDIGQNLALARMRLSEIRDSATLSEAQRCAEAIGEHLDEAIRATRTLAFELSSPVLYDIGLEAAIRQLVEHTGEQTRVRFGVRTAAALPTLSVGLNIVLYRAVAELLLNVRKHANCDEAEVAIEPEGKTLRFTVRDNGQGFDAAATENMHSLSGGFGLFNIREQLEHFGGRLEIESAPGSGTAAVIIAPLDIEDENGL